MNPAQHISLCMVVRDEADVLEKTLRSILPAVQEVIFVDTGSRDDTIRIAKQFGVKVFTFPWQNDFSAARNFSLQLATQPWILVLDADEVLSPGDHSTLSLLLTSEEAAAYSLTQRNYLEESGKLSWTESWTPNKSECDEGREYKGYLDIPIVRLFPRRPDIRFSGCVHESIEDSLTRIGLHIKASGLIVHHYGHVRSPGRMERKKQLYLKLGLTKLEQNPSPRAQFELGTQCQELGLFEQAIPHFLEAVNQSSEFRIADLFLGICFSRLGKLDAARFHLSRAQTSQPSSAGLLCELGLVNLKEGKIGEAMNAFEKALAMNPDHVSSLCYLGSLLTNQDRVLQGINLLKKATLVDPNHFDSWMNLGLAYQKCRRPLLARDCLKKAYALRPENADVAKQLAVSYIDAGRYLEATQVLSQAVERNPQNERLGMYWAATLSLSGQESRGREVYESISKAGGKFAHLAQRQLERFDQKRNFGEVSG